MGATALARGPPWIAWGRRSPISSATEASRRQIANADSALRELGDVTLRWYCFVGRENAGTRDLLPRLHHTGDGERISGGALHRADPAVGIEIVEQLPPDGLGLSTLRALGDDAQRDQV